jgi:hypothetical protein
MIWEEFRTPPKFGCEIPGPEGPGFWRPDEHTSLVLTENILKINRKYTERDSKIDFGRAGHPSAL